MTQLPARQSSVDSEGKSKPARVTWWVAVNVLIPLIMTAVSAGLMWGKLNGENDLRDYKTAQLREELTVAKALAATADSSSAQLKIEVVKLTGQLENLNANVNRLSNQLERRNAP